jgi:hypothetical protein
MANQPHIIRLKHAGEQVIVQYGGRERVVTAQFNSMLTASPSRDIKEAEDRTIIRVTLSNGQMYAYQNSDGAVLGDLVAVRLPNGQVITEKVQAYGPGHYRGRVHKVARRVQLPVVP